MRVLGALIVSVVLLPQARAQTGGPKVPGHTRAAAVDPGLRANEVERRTRDEQRRQDEVARRAQQDARFRVRRIRFNPAERVRLRAWAVTRRPPILQVRPPFRNGRSGRPGGAPTAPRGRFRVRTPEGFGRIPPARASSIRTGSPNLRVVFRPPGKPSP